MKCKHIVMGLTFVWLWLGCNNGDSNHGVTDEESTTIPLSLDDPLFTNWTPTVAEWITDEWYMCRNEQSACGLPCQSDDMWVAINEEDFRESRTCGTCMEVRTNEVSVTVEVIENCGGACVENEIELSSTAFSMLGNLDNGHQEVSWRLVPCARTGGIQVSFETDSTEWWAGIQIRNATLPVDYIEIWQDDAWHHLEMDDWNHFPVSGDFSAGTISLRITAVTGEQLVENDIDYIPGATVMGTQQFSGAK